VNRPRARLDFLLSYTARAVTIPRALLWLLFLLLAERQIESWNPKDNLSTLGSRFHSNLLHISRLARAPSFTKPSSVSETEATAPPQVAVTPSFSLSNQTLWPSGTSLRLPDDPRIFIVEEDENKRSWIYRSEHFDFVSNAPLRRHVIREFATLFELTYLYCQKLPFNLSRANHSDESQKLQVQLIEDYTHYVARGGAPGSGGVYLSDIDLVLVPFEGLGLKVSHGGYALDHLRTNQTLMHEATHMLMRGPLLKDGWFVEGAAEYVATIPIRQNALLLSRHATSIKNYVTSAGYGGRGGHGLGTKIELSPLKDFMEADYDDYQATPHAYPYALLLFHYFAHYDGEKDGKLKRLNNSLVKAAESWGSNSLSETSFHSPRNEFVLFLITSEEGHESP